MAVGQQFVWLATLSTFVRLLTYGLCIASLPIIEKTVPAAAGQFRLPGGLAIPCFALLLTLWLLSQSTLENFAIAGCVVVAGTVGYWLCTRKRATASAFETAEVSGRSDRAIDDDRA